MRIILITLLACYSTPLFNQEGFSAIKSIFSLQPMVYIYIWLPVIFCVRIFWYYLFTREGLDKNNAYEKFVQDTRILKF